MYADDTTYAFARTLDPTTLVVVVNAGDEAQQVRMLLKDVSATPMLPDVLHGMPDEIDIHKSDLVLTLASRSGVVLDVSGPGENKEQKVENKEQDMG